MLQSGEAHGVVVPSIDYGIMAPNPPSNLEKADVLLGSVRQSGKIRGVKLLSIQKSGLLQDADSLKSAQLLA